MAKLKYVLNFLSHKYEIKDNIKKNVTWPKAEGEEFNLCCFPWSSPLSP